MIRLPHLETNVGQACQNRCVGCNHFVPFTTHEFRDFLEPAELERDLRIFSRLVHVEGYAMIGGEPTLHPALDHLLRIARKSGVADVLEIWSNGQDLDGNEGWWGSVDKLVVSRYPGKLIDGELQAIERWCLENGVSLRVIDEGVVPNFSRLLEPANTDAETTRRKFGACFFKGYSRVLDRGYFFRCCTSPYIPRLLQGRKFGDDGLRIDERTTEVDIHAFLGQSEPMESCRICAGREGRGEPLVWREIRDPGEWKKASAGL